VSNERECKLIVLEGPDAAGKKTQTDLAKAALQSQGLTVTVLSFPRYETFFGKLIRDALDGKLGDFLHLHPKLASLPYMLDRLCARVDLEAARESSDVVICNRYMESNVAFCMAKIADPVERHELMKWLYQAEYVEMDFIPHADRVIVLDADVSVSAKLHDIRGEKKDLYEADRDFQAHVLECYRALAASQEKWCLIKCNEGEIMRTPAAIHEDVMGAITKLMALPVG
jgi:dTMP kinase